MANVRRQHFPTLFCVLGVFLAGIWLGEHRRGFVPDIPEIAAALLASVVAGVDLWRTSKVAAIVGGIGLNLLFLSSWVLGMTEANFAFNECVAEGESVREALVRYRTNYGKFPESLTELAMPVPGRLLFPPHTLKYERTLSGYRLHFGDSMIEFNATESEAFMAHK